MEKLINKINELKREKNAVILAHCYQNVEIDEVADFVGDSLYLSRMAKNTNADIIIFAGVSFMAETAKLLSPEKRVFLPRKESGCAMADMITPEALEEFKSEHPNKPVRVRFGKWFVSRRKRFNKKMTPVYQYILSRVIENNK